MNQFEFVDYTSTPTEKHYGIVRIKAFNKIILRYKIMPKKDGSGYFPVCASYKIPIPGADDTYVSAFMLDSNSDKEELENLIRANVKKPIEAQLRNLGASVFSESPSQAKVTELENEALPF